MNHRAGVETKGHKAVECQADRRDHQGRSQIKALMISLRPVIDTQSLNRPETPSINMVLQIFFYRVARRSDIFAAEHGSWNKRVRAGYELIRIPLHQSGSATGEYEDFLTGFAIDNKRVWGRPARVAIGLDGSVFVTDDASNSIWRVKYVGHECLRSGIYCALENPEKIRAGTNYTALRILSFDAHFPARASHHTGFDASFAP